MKRYWIVSLALLLLMLVLCRESYTSPLLQSGEILAATSDDWGQIAVDDSYKLVNNVWNKNAAHGSYQQKIFHESINGKSAIGWQWQWPEQNLVLAYPEVIYGDKPWDTPSGQIVPNLPFQADSKQMIVNYVINYNENTTGIFNAAFSLWAVSEMPATKDQITHEIMIWVDNHGLRPAGTKIDTIQVDGTSYSVYQRKNHGDSVNYNKWTYIAFVADKPLLKGPLDITKFLGYLIKERILPKERFITSLELGNEVVYGQGLVEICDLSVQIN
jgi:hypothetical protein